MPGIYPLNPVITSNPAFASLYDMHPLSLYLISECLTPSEAARLLDEGAVFDTVVLLGGEGKELADRLASEEDSQAQTFAQVERIDLPAVDEQAVNEVHRVLKGHTAQWFFRTEPDPASRRN